MWARSKLLRGESLLNWLSSYRLGRGDCNIEGDLSHDQVIKAFSSLLDGRIILELVHRLKEEDFNHEMSVSAEQVSIYMYLWIHAIPRP